MDDKAGRLQLSYNAFLAARHAWEQHHWSTRLTNEEKQALHQAFQAAENQLDSIMDAITRVSILTVYTIGEAETFVSLLPDFLANRGQLEQVYIGTDHGLEKVETISDLLQAAGLTLASADLIFDLPAEE